MRWRRERLVRERHGVVLPNRDLWVPAHALWKPPEKRSNLAITNLIGFAAGGEVDFPTVRGTNTSFVDTLTTSHPIALPAGLQAGDRLIILATFNTTTVTTPANWTQLYTMDIAIRAWGAYKISDGTEGASVTVTIADNRRGAHCSYRISGAGSVEAAAATGSWDCPNLAPSWPLGNTLWLASGHGRGTVSGTPANYTDQITATDAVDPQRVVSMRRARAAASEDPGAYTLSSAEFQGSSTIAIQAA